jgi:hypothetical protein
LPFKSKGTKKKKRKRREQLEQQSSNHNKHRPVAARMRAASLVALGDAPASTHNAKTFSSNKLFGSNVPDRQHHSPEPAEKRFRTSGYEGRAKNEVLAPSLPIKIPPSVTDKLVYIHESLNYCDGDRKRLIPSTTGRRCTKDSTKGDSCDVLCCGRGYNTQVSYN